MSAGEFSGRKILIVDDDDMVCDFLVAQCCAYGFEASSALSGEEAFERMKEAPPDLVITDVMMPGIDGIELLRRVKKTPSLQGIPVLVISGIYEMEQVAECISLGAEDHLVKPVESTILFARIKASLEKKDLQRRLFEAERCRLEDDLLSRMVGTISHNFNQPLTVANATLNTLRRMTGMLRAHSSFMLEHIDDESRKNMEKLSREFWDKKNISSYISFMRSMEECERDMRESISRISGLVSEVSQMIRPRDQDYVGGDKILDLIGSSKFTILVAEDDGETLNLHVKRFLAQGYHVITARDGIEAERHIRFSRPHLAVFDCHMPRLDALREVFRLKHEGEVAIPFIVLSSSGESTAGVPYKYIRNVDAYIRREGPKSLDKLTCTANDLLAQAYPDYAASTLKQAIEARREAEAELEIAEKKLRQAEKMQAIGQLAGGVAHDFNNQLAAILGYGELIRHDPKDASRVADFSQMILEAAERSKNLTQQLLAFSRDGPKVIKPVDVNTLIVDMAVMLDHSIDKRIEVTLNMSAEKPVVSGDASEIQNALLNLCINAGDAMLDGGVLVLSTYNNTFPEGIRGVLPQDLPSGEYLCISVEDNGCGMSEEMIDRIFEPFYTTKPEGKGTGLGLASVYGTVQAHEGGIGVRSVPDCGTVFTIYLAGPTDCVTESPMVEGMEPVPGKEHILVVDDEEPVLDMTAEIIGGLGYSVTKCRSGDEAIMMCARPDCPFDLALLDVSMPEISGREAYRAIKEKNDHIRIVLFSGHRVGADIQDLVDSGKIGFLQKPFSMLELSNSIRAALESKSGVTG